MVQGYQVVDLFAGPGGLAEGFSSLRDADGDHPFQVTLSVEKEASAHRTLQLRAFLRQFEEFPQEYYDALNAGEPPPDWSKDFPGEWETAQEEALKLELGTPDAAIIIDERLAELKELRVPTILIGGPPCQAYSLVGRVRNQAISSYIPEKDHRHFLYREYIRILSRLEPVAFVMENVKGMLSSTLHGQRVFEQVLVDLRAAGGHADSYELFALALDCEDQAVLRRTSRHSDFVVRSEAFGVPQARHRVIVVGLRKDVASELGPSSDRTGAPTPDAASVRDVLSGLPSLRSGLSTGDSASEWRQMVLEQMNRVLNALEGEEELHELLNAARNERDKFSRGNDALPRTSMAKSVLPESCPTELADWLSDERLNVTLNHASRSHMVDDLGRYFFSAVFTQVRGRAPKASEFPTALAPDHANWESGKFADRFRTQGWDQASTTITSHIAKDGHYFIHPDPQQCRALTVREAARLQTFPDNYLFLGNRTEQYIQVGNAVPPFLAHQLAAALYRTLS